MNTLHQEFPILIKLTGSDTQSEGLFRAAPLKGTMTSVSSFLVGGPSRA